MHAAAGGVGLWLVQLLHAVGAGKIIATASTDEKLALAAAHGATHTVNYSRGSADWVARVNEITADEGGVAAVFDGVGRDTFDGDLDVVARKGTVVSFGNASGPVPPLTITRLTAKNIKVLRPQLYGYVATKQELAEYAGELLDLVHLKKVSVRLHKTYPLADARQAHMVSFTLPSVTPLAAGRLAADDRNRISRGGLLQESFSIGCREQLYRNMSSGSPPILCVRIRISLQL